MQSVTSSMKKNILLAVEFAALFILIPLLLYYRVLPNVPIPFLVLLALFAWLVLRADPQFDKSHLTNVDALQRDFWPVLGRSAGLCVLLGLGVWWLRPQWLF